VLTRQQKIIKRLFDVSLATAGLLATGWLIVLTVFLARFETGHSGLFRQCRIGRDGHLFRIYKIRTMHEIPSVTSHVTTATDPRITRLGRYLRKTKIDELPQLLNVLRGDMSFVGPRPDMSEMLAQLRQKAPEVLSVRPGITGPASLKYRHEEQMLASSDDPEWINDNLLFPDKMRINVAYVRNSRLWGDLQYLWQTVAGTGMLALEKEFHEGINDEKQAA